jgi:Icc-related predicted phosphoesterase
VFYSKITDLSKVHLLDPGSVVIDGVTFIGATLWTNFDNGNESAIRESKRCINDFKLMVTHYDGTSFVRVTPEWMMKQHKYELGYIRETCKATAGPKVVVSHFPPIRNFQHKKWGTMKENPLNGYFMSDLDAEIEDLGVITWIAGHTHDSSRFNKHGIDFICNPRGYVSSRGAENPSFDQNLVVEVQ